MNTATQQGSLLFALCMIINIIMVGSIGLFSLLLLTKETIQFRISSHKQIYATHALLNYGINTILAQNNQIAGDAPGEIVIKVPEVPGMSPEIVGMIHIVGTSTNWQVQSQLIRGQTVLCKISCTLEQGADGKRVIRNWQMG